MGVEMMLENKNIMQIARLVVGCIVITISPYICATVKVENIPGEWECSKGPKSAPWVTFDGIPGTQYTLTTKGLYENGKESVTEVVDIDNVPMTRDGVLMIVGAKCMPSLEEGAAVSLTGSSLVCGVGEGIAVKMFAPNNINSNKYHYVGTIAVRHTEEIQEITNSNVTKISDSKKKQLQFDGNIKVVTPKQVSLY